MSSLDAVRSDCLKPCVESFKASVRRLACLQGLPVDLITLSVLFTSVSCQVISRELGKNASFDDLVGCRSNPALSAPLAAEFRASIDRFTEAQEALSRTFSLPGFIDSLAWFNQCRESADAILTHSVLGAWTAFECLAGDLWCAGVDNGPKEVKGRLSLYGDWNKSKESLGHKRAGELDHHPVDEYGSFMRAAGWASFQNLKDIRNLYEAAFGDSVADLFKTTSGGDINALSAFRNVLAHSAGKVDRQFRKQVEAFDEFRNLPLKQPVQLDGELVRRLTNASVLLGTALIHAVDNIISPPEGKGAG